MPTRAFSQPFNDPNTGASYAATCLVPFVTVDTVQQVGNIVVRRYASQTTYSNGYKPIDTQATLVIGVTYGSVFGSTAAAAAVSLNAEFLSLAINYLAGAPEYSGATAL